jgi:glycosyltransferase involved in cell wall biosynthesis
LRFAGAYRQEDLPELLTSADVVVVPSIWEDCAPLVVAEALAARAPVIGSRIGGIPDFVRHGVDGLLFGPGDATGLARCLGAFVEDRGLLGRMQAAIGAPAGFGAYVDAVLAAHAECRARAALPSR